MRRCLTAVAAAAALLATGTSASQKAAIVGVYKHHNGQRGALEVQLEEATSEFGSSATRSVVECEHPTSIDVTSDDRISVGARPGLLLGARRGYEDLVDTSHVAEYLGHVQALKAFVDSNADVGIILWHPEKVPASAVSALWAALPSAASGPVPSEVRAAGKAQGAGARSAASAAPVLHRSLGSDASSSVQWDVLLLGWDVAPTSANSGRSVMAALIGDGAAPGGAEAIGAAGAQQAKAAAAAKPRKMDSSSPTNVAEAKGWRGLYGYAVTRAAARALLASALPMNVRWWAQVAAFGELKELRVAWSPAGSLFIPTAMPDAPVTCDLCDLPPGFNRISHVRDQLLLGAVLGYGVVFAISYLLSKFLPGGVQGLLSGALTALGTALGRKGSDSTEDDVVPVQQGGQSRWRMACGYVSNLIRHPFTHMLVLGVAGYLGALVVVQAPWPAERFANLGQLGALEKVQLSGQAARDWEAFAVATNASSTRVHHATVSTLDHPNLDRLINSAGWYGDKVTVLGMNDPRFVEWGKGFGVKLELVHEFVKSLPPDDLLLFTDAFDVLLMTSHHDVRHAFLHAVKLAMAREKADPAGAVPARVPSILFSAEFFCHPDPNRTVAYPDVDRQYADFPYLNSGTYIGRAGDIAGAMDVFSNYTLGDDDQRYWTDIYLASRHDASLPRVVLDHENDVFLCMSGYRMEWHLDFDPAIRRYKYKKTPGLPTIIHFNGRKDDVGPFYDALLMKWSPYSLSTSKGLQVVVAMLVILAFPLGVSIGRALDGLGLGLGTQHSGGAAAGKGCCAACRRRVQVAASTAAVAGIRHEKDDE